MFAFDGFKYRENFLSDNIELLGLYGHEKTPCQTHVDNKRAIIFLMNLHNSNRNYIA